MHLLLQAIPNQKARPRPAIRLPLRPQRLATNAAVVEATVADPEEVAVEVAVEVEGVAESKTTTLAITITRMVHSRMALTW